MSEVETVKPRGITLTRALSELKRLDNQITERINKTQFISVKGEMRDPPVSMKKVVATHQSIEDLIEYRRKLKSAIIMSNAVTVVNICDREMTVAEAIEEKQSIKHKRTLLSAMRRQYAAAQVEIDTQNNNVRRKLENELLAQNAKSASSDETASARHFQEMQKSYKNLHTIKFHDPLGLESKIEKLDKYINDFTTEVDHVLVESNAVTRVLQ